MSPWFNLEDTPETVVAALDQRKREQRRVALLGEVRRRDGDQCRACRTIVDFVDRRSGLAGSYYLSNPANPATVEEAFMVCRRCLGTGEPLQILPAPRRPVYSTDTSEWLAKHILAAEQAASDVVKGQLRIDVQNSKQLSDAGAVSNADLVMEEDASQLSTGGKPVLLEVFIDPVIGGHRNGQEKTAALRVSISHNVQQCSQFPGLKLRVDSAVGKYEFEFGHNSSPSVGAPSGAVCDNPNPTDGELNPGAAAPSPAAAPVPTQTTVQE